VYIPYRTTGSDLLKHPSGCPAVRGQCKSNQTLRPRRPSSSTNVVPPQSLMVSALKGELSIDGLARKGSLFLGHHQSSGMHTLSYQDQSDKSVLGGRQTKPPNHMHTAVLFYYATVWVCRLHSAHARASVLRAQTCRQRRVAHNLGGSNARARRLPWWVAVTATRPAARAAC